MTKKTVAKTDSRNKNKALAEKNVSDVIATLLADKKDSGRDVKADKFCLYMAFGFPIETCARLSGCSMSWAYKLHAKYAKDTKKLIDRVAEIAGQAKDSYQILTKLKLPLIAQLDDLGIAEYRENPRLIVEKPSFLRQLKRVTGVIEEQVVMPTMIPVNVAVRVQSFLEREQQPQLERVVDAEIEEEENG
jgi:hypothetical protein